MDIFVYLFLSKCLSKYLSNYALILLGRGLHREDTGFDVRIFHEEQNVTTE